MGKKAYDKIAEGLREALATARGQNEPKRPSMPSKRGLNPRPHPDLPMPHPGSILADDLAATGESKSALAVKLGISRRALYDILEGKSSISAAMALRLEKVAGSSAEFWLNLQCQHDLRVARSALKSPKPKPPRKRAA